MRIIIAVIIIFTLLIIFVIYRGFGDIYSIGAALFLLAASVLTVSLKDQTNKYLGSEENTMDTDLLTEQEKLAFKQALKTKPHFDRVWHSTNPKLPFRQNDIFAINKHFGQRKLFLTELEFLTIYGDMADTVLYIGSAPGGHIPFLLALFPTHNFILYDLQNHDPFLLNHPRVEIYKEYFTDEKATEYKDKKILFISDIRNLGTSRSSNKEELIEIDMEGQLKWTKIMNPEVSMLKFRENYMKKEFNYLAGTIYIQPWMRPGSSEGRLMVLKNAALTSYDTVAYTQSMYYHNLITRQSYFDYDSRIKVFGADHCYDCRSEFDIIEKYVRKALPNLDDDSVYEAISEMSYRLNKTLNQYLKSPPHGLFPNDKDTLKRVIKMYEFVRKNKRIS